MLKSDKILIFLTDQSLSSLQSGLWQRSSLSLKAETSLKEAFTGENGRTDERHQKIHTHTGRKDAGQWAVPGSRPILSNPCNMLSLTKNPKTMMDQEFTWVVSVWVLEQPPFPEQQEHLDVGLLVRSSPPQICLCTLCLLLNKQWIVNSQAEVV